MPEPRGKLKVFEAPVRLAAKVLFIGPLIKEVVLPPNTVPLVVLRWDNILVVVVVSMPLVSVRVPEEDTSTGLFKVTPPLVLAIVRLPKIALLVPDPVTCIVWAAPPLKVTVRPLFVKEVVFEFCLNQFPPTDKLPDVAFNAKVPLVIVRFPKQERSVDGIVTVPPVALIITF